MSSPILWGPNNTANNLQQNFNQTGRFVGAAIAVPWASGIVYAVGDLVVSGNNTYYCKAVNTGGADFSSDFALGYWSQINTPIVGKNYVQVGSNFETNTVEGWQLFNIAGYVAGSLPSVAPTIGSATSITVASTATNPLDGKYSLQVSNVASTNITAGHGIISQVYTIDIADQAKVLATTLNYQATTGSTFQNYSGTSSNTWALYIYDVTNSAWIQPAGVYNLVQTSGVGKCSSTWQTPSNMTQFRIALLCINSTTGSSPALDTIQTTFDDFYCGPQPFSMGPAMSEMQSYTPTVTGSGGNPNLGTNATQVGYWQRVGQNMKLWIKVISGTSPTPGTGYYEFSIPDFATIDTTYINLNTIMSNTKGIVTTNGTPLGVGQAGSGTLTHVSGLGTVIATSNKKIAVNLPAQSVTTTTLINQEYTFGSGGTNLYDFGTAGVGIFIQCEFPVVGWGTNTIQSADTDTRVIASSVNAAGQTFANSATDLQITSLTASIDTTSSWASSAYTVPVSGYYRVYPRVDFNTSITGLVIIKYKINNAATVALGASNSLNQFATIGTYKILRLNAGDVLKFYINNNTTSNPITIDLVTIDIDRLSGPAVVQATETVAASYTSSSGQTLTSTGIYIFNNKNYDTHNFYNQSTGIGIFPVSGKYRISWVMQTNNTTDLASVSWNAQVRVNSTVLATLLGTNAGIVNNAVNAGSYTVNVLAGQTFDLYNPNPHSAGSLINNANYNWLTIERIGN